MTSLTRISALALTALIASTSFATAGNGPFGINLNLPQLPQLPQGNGGNGGNGNGGIIVLPKFPQLPQPPKPKIPFIPVVLNLNFLGDAHHKDAMPGIDCDVRTSVATTDDLWIVNVGNVVLPAGTRLHYSVPSTGDRGAFLLPQSIEIGQKLKVSDVLHGATAGAPCAVKILM